MIKRLTISFILLFTLITPAHASEKYVIKSEIGLKKTELSRMISGARKAENYYNRSGFKIRENYLIVVNKSKDYLINTLLESNCVNPHIKSVSSPGNYAVGDYCMGNYRAIAIHSAQYSDSIIMAHEMFHHWQMANSKGLYPVWFWEGSATIFSIYAHAHNNRSKTVDQWYNYLYPNKCTMQCEYQDGALRVHNIIKNYGAESYRRLYSEYEISFEYTYRKVIGQDIEFQV